MEVPPRWDHSIICDIVMQKIRNQDIAVIGIGVKLPHANNLYEFERILIEKENCVDDIPECRRKLTIELDRMMGREEQRHFAKAAYLPNIDLFDSSFFQMSPLEAVMMDPNQRIFLETAVDAIEDAGLGGSKLRRSNTGVFYCSTHQLEYFEMLKTIRPELETAASLDNLPPFAPARLAYIFDFKGPNFVLNSSCASSLVAVLTACRSLARKECNVAIVGGSRIQVRPIQNSRMGNESRTGYTMSFSKGSDGTGGGEGSVSMVLKPLADALYSNDNIYGVIRGGWINHNGRGASFTTPNAAAQTDVILQAWKDCAINPAEFGYIEAFGSGTQLGDAIEIVALSHAFSKFTNCKQFCATGSVKTNFGHLDCVSGLLGLVKTLLSVKNKRIYPQLFFEEPNPLISFSETALFVSTEVKEWKASAYPRIAAINSFSSSGTNCHIVVAEPPNLQTNLQKKGKWQILFLSAIDRPAFIRLLTNYINYIQFNPNFSLSNLCQVSNRRNSCRKYRAVIKLENSQMMLDLLEKLRSYMQGDLTVPTEDFLNQFELSENHGRNARFSVNGFGDFEGVEQVVTDYLAGQTIAFKTLYPSENSTDISVPLYPFDNKKYWLPMLDNRLYNGGKNNEEKNN